GSRRADGLRWPSACPPLVVIPATAIVSRAFANWAATAYISGVVVVVALMIRHGAWRWLMLSLALGVLAQAAALASDARATKLNLPGLGDAYRRTLGWSILGSEAGRLARQVGARAIVGDQRDDVASLLYYWRDQPEPVLALAAGGSPTPAVVLT